MPLDSYVDYPVILMDVLPGDPYVPTIWKDYRAVIDQYALKSNQEQAINKFDFYERAQKAYAVVTTSETALYANMILKKRCCNG